MEPRSTTRARLRVRPIPEPGLIIIGYLLPLFGLELLGMARDVATTCRRGWGSFFGVSFLGVRPRRS
jgi:hypothetical protein